LKLVWPFDRHFKLQIAHVLPLADAEVTTEKLLLEGRDLRTDVAILIVPFVDGRVGEIVGHVSVMAGLAYRVVDRLGVDPAGFLGTLSERGSLSLGDGPSEWSHVEVVSGGVGRLSCCVAKAGLSSAAVGGVVRLPGCHGCVRVCGADLMDWSEGQCVVGVREMGTNASKALVYCMKDGGGCCWGRELVEEGRREEADD
jgi:hypothetical protein